MKLDLLKLLQEINTNYASVLGAIFSLILVVITLLYVILTYFQVKTSKDSVNISHQFLEQAEKQMKHSKVPMLVVEVDKTYGSPYFGEERRQLGINIKIRNIGDGPAIQTHVRMKLIYKYVEFNYYEELFEHTFVGNIGIGEEREADLHFETMKIEKMLEDLSISYAKNTFRVKNNPSKKAYAKPEISIEVIYSNFYGQFFKSHLIHPILGLISRGSEPDETNESDDVAAKMEGEEGGEEEGKKGKYIHDPSELKDDERFSLGLINPIFQTFSFNPLDSHEANQIIEKYKELA